MDRPKHDAQADAPLHETKTVQMPGFGVHDRRRDARVGNITAREGSFWGRVEDGGRTTEVIPKCLPPPPSEPTFAVLPRPIAIAGEPPSGTPERPASVPLVSARAETASRPAPAHVRKHDPHTRLFRSEALAAHARGERAASVLRVTSVSRWAVLAVLGLALLMAAALTAFGSVEETTAARGVLRAAFGVQSVVASLAGTVREVVVQAGDHVRAGDVIARIDAAPLEAELMAAEQRLASIEEEWAEARKVIASTHARSAQLFAARTAQLKRGEKRQLARVARRDERAARLQDPGVQAAVEELVREGSADAVDSARDELMRASEELAALRLSAATAYSQYRQGLAAGEQRVREARAQRDSVRSLLKQTELRASSTGLVESLRVHAGQVIQAGDWVARVVRDEAPRTLVAFVPERDVAFLRPGAIAAVELDQLPMGEFGHLDAQVVRVAGELADRSELVAALGDSASSAPHVRVELRVLATAGGARLGTRLRPGTLVTARIPLRERRLLAIVFEPARRWLD